MDFNIPLNSVASPLWINTFICLSFLFLYLFKKDTRGEWLKTCPAVLIGFVLSYFMTKSSFLIQATLISLYIQLIILLFFETIKLHEWGKIPLVILGFVGCISTLFFNITKEDIIVGVCFSALILLSFYIRYNFFNKDESKKEFFNLRLSILLIATGLFFGFNNLFLIILIYITLFMCSFLIIFFMDNDNTKLEPCFFIILSILTWFATIYYLPQIDILRLII